MALPIYMILIAVIRGVILRIKLVIRGWNLLQKFHVETNILCCVQALNATHPLEVYRYFRDELHAQFLQFIPIVEPSPNCNAESDMVVSEYSVTGKQYGEFLISIFEDWVHNDVGNIFVQLFDVSLAAWLKQPPGLCVYAKMCGTALALEHTGDLYSCDHFVTTDHKLGNISERDLRALVEINQQYQFGAAKYTQLPPKCKKCGVLFACYGGCPKDRLIPLHNGETPINFLCDGYYAFFQHINRFMELMANLLMSGHPANEIMGILNMQRNL